MKRFISGSEGACVNQCQTKQAHRLLLAAAMSLSLGIIPAAAATRSSVQEAHSSGGRVAVFEKVGSASGATDVVPFPGVVERDDEKHEVRASFDPGPQAATSQTGRSHTSSVSRGRVVVRNFTGYAVDVFITLDDYTTPWVFIGTVPDGYRLVVKEPRGLPYILGSSYSGECSAGFWCPDDHAPLGASLDRLHHRRGDLQDGPPALRIKRRRQRRHRLPDGDDFEPPRTMWPIFMLDVSLKLAVTLGRSLGG